MITDYELLRTLMGNIQKKHKKVIQNIFKDKGLEIIIRCKIVDNLDVTLNLNDAGYRPFHKPNRETTYIHVESGHPS